MKTKTKADQLEQLVGEQVYSVWVDMLRRLVPDGRTHPSAGGEDYSLASEAIREYLDWFNMPWE